MSNIFDKIFVKFPISDKPSYKMKKIGIIILFLGFACSYLEHQCIAPGINQVKKSGDKRS